MIVIEFSRSSLEAEIEKLRELEQTCGPMVKMYCIGALKTLNWLNFGTPPPSVIDHKFGHRKDDLPADETNG
jgi:hypothetical protein